jgi:hypothetical protein
MCEKLDGSKEFYEQAFIYPRRKFTAGIDKEGGFMGAQPVLVDGSRVVARASGGDGLAGQQGCFPFGAINSGLK